MVDVRYSAAGVLTAAALLAAGAPANAAAPVESRSTQSTQNTITVSTYNICKQECGRGQWAWRKRIPKVARTILASDSDVVAIQEAYRMTRPLMKILSRHGYVQAGTQSGTDGCGAGCVQESHILYNSRTISATPLLIPSPPEPEPCRIFPDGSTGEVPAPTHTEPQPVAPVEPIAPTKKDTKEYREYEEAMQRYKVDLDAYQQQYNEWVQDEAAYQQAYATWKSQARQLRVQYRENDCELYDPWPATRDGSTGYPSLKLLSEEWRGTATERLAAWAVLTDNATSTQFMVATAHMPPEKTPGAEATRRAATRAFLGHLAEVRSGFGAPNMPTFLAGDLNSFEERQPKGAHWIVQQAGFVDAWRAPKKINRNFNTVNYTGMQRDPFPAKPIRSRNGTPARIDYVFNNAGFEPLSYEVMLRLKGGRFDRAFQGSDHNLVRTVWAIPGSYSPAATQQLAMEGKRAATDVVHANEAWLAKPYFHLQEQNLS